MDATRRIAALGTLATLALAPAVARADTIVFQRGGDVWLMAPDGSGARAVTHGGHAYEWPSEADDGTIVAGDGTGSLFRLTQRGEAIGAPIPTAATTTSEDFPAEPPTHVRISPDGLRIAYDEVIDDDVTTLWTPFGATGVELPGQTGGQDGLASPSWIGNGGLLLSRDVIAAAPGDSTFARYDLGGDDTSVPWFSDPGSAWATGIDAAVSRDGTRVAAMEDDAAENGGDPEKVVIRLFVAPDFRCEIALKAEETYAQASPTFSPDGTRLAWAQSDGIHVATLGDLSDCAAIRQRVVTAAGAWEPYWSPAADSAPGAGGGGGGAPVTGAKLTLRIKARSHPLRAFITRHGVGARITCSAACTVRVTLRHRVVVGAATRKRDRAGTIVLHLRLRPAAVRALRKPGAYRLILRAAAPGATPVSATIRPR